MSLFKSGIYFIISRIRVIACRLEAPYTDVINAALTKVALTKSPCYQVVVISACKHICAHIFFGFKSQIESWRYLIYNARINHI